MARRRSRRKRLVRRLLVGLVVLLTIGGVVGVIVWYPTGSRRRHQIERGTPVAAIYYTCDLQGKLVPCTCEEGELGGVARIAGLVGQWKADRADAIIVDAGNATILDPDDAQAINRFTIEALGLIGCSVVNCGENEAALPRDRLEALAKACKAHMVSACITDAASGNTVVPAYHIEARAGVQVAFIGLVHNDMDPVRIGKGLRLIAPEDALRAALASIGDQADLVVALACLPAEQIYALARKYPKVNIFLGGKAGASSAAYELVRHTVVAYLGDQGCSVGRLEAAFPHGKLPDVRASMHVLDKSVPEAEAMSDLVARFTKAVAAEKRPGADFDPKMPCTSSFVAAEVCKLCHISEFYSWQATDHAGAYVTLLQKDKHKDPACLVCHVTGYTMPAGYAAKQRELDAEQDLGKKASRQRALDALKNVGCECCHGGARRHVAASLKDRTAVARTPYQRAVVSARSCTRCHNGRRPCLGAEEADAFDLEDYLAKIKHWP